MKKTALILTSLISIACAGQQLKTGSVLVKDSITVGGVGITEFSIDGTLGGNSDDAIPTEKAVKTYVDAATPAESDPVWVSDSADYINKSDTASYSSSILDRVVTSEADPVWVSDSADFVNTYEHGLKADKTAIDSLLGTGKYAIDTAAQNLALRGDIADSLTNSPNVLQPADTISMSSQIGLKADYDSPTFTTAAYVPTAAATDSSTHAANTAWVKRHLRTRYEIDSLVISGSNIIAYEGGDTLSIYVPYANRTSPVQYAAADTAGTTPAYIGQLFVDTRTGTTYVGNSTARGGWVILNYFFALCLIGKITRKDEV